MKSLRLLIMLILAFGISANSLYGASIVVKENFEEGKNWEYKAPWIYDSYIHDEWNIVSTSPHSGTWCAQSKSPGDGVLEDSIWMIGIPTDTDEIFLRFWFKAGSNLSAYWAQWMRMKMTSGGDIEVGMGVGEPEPRGSGIIKMNQAAFFPTAVPYITSWSDFTSDTNWTEYAMYIKYSTNTLYTWKNAKSYSTNDSSWRAMPVTWGGSKVREIWFTMYYKRGLSSSKYSGTTYWIDDIEIWKDGIPGGVSEYPPIEEAESPEPPTGLHIIN